MKIQYCSRILFFGIFLIICLFFTSSSFASRSYSTESKRMMSIFSELKLLFENYKENTGNYPVNDSNSTAMYKLAIFLNTNGYPNNDKMRYHSILELCLKDFWDYKINTQLINLSYDTNDLTVEMFDLWGNPIQILIPGKENPVDFYSLGRNGKFNNYDVDDILSWGNPYDERYNKYYPIPLKMRIDWFISDIICSPIPLIVVPLIFILILFSLFKKRS